MASHGDRFTKLKFDFSVQFKLHGPLPSRCVITTERKSRKEEEKRKETKRKEKREILLFNDCCWDGAPISISLNMDLKTTQEEAAAATAPEIKFEADVEPVKMETEAVEDQDQDPGSKEEEELYVQEFGTIPIPSGMSDASPEVWDQIFSLETWNGLSDQIKTHLKVQTRHKNRQTFNVIVH